jgi:hypothetical protein
MSLVRAENCGERMSMSLNRRRWRLIGLVGTSEKKTAKKEENNALRTWLVVIGSFLGTTGVFAFLGEVIVSYNSMKSAQTLERQRFEYELIAGVLSEEEVSQEEVVKQLRFLIDIGAIKSLDSEELDAILQNPESLPESLPESPFFRRSGVSR